MRRARDLRANRCHIGVLIGGLTDRDLRGIVMVRVSHTTCTATAPLGLSFGICESILFVPSLA